MNSNVCFVEALKALKQGKRVARSGWNEIGLFVFMQVPADISMEIVPKMQSLPQSVKDEFERRLDAQLKDEYEGDYISSTSREIYYRNQFAIVYPDNTISGWSASSSDVLSNDWEILD